MKWTCATVVPLVKKKTNWQTWLNRKRVLQIFVTATNLSGTVEFCRCLFFWSTTPSSAGPVAFQTWTRGRSIFCIFFDAMGAYQVMSFGICLAQVQEAKKMVQRHWRYFVFHLPINWLPARLKRTMGAPCCFHYRWCRRLCCDTLHLSKICLTRLHISPVATRGALMGLSPTNKAPSPPNLNYETL